MIYDTKKCGERIRQLRLENGFTQELVASKLDVDRSFYNRIETGKKGCSIDLFVRISELFRVSLDYLILGKNSGALLVEADRIRVKRDIAELVVHLEEFKNSL